MQAKCWLGGMGATGGNWVGQDRTLARRTLQAISRLEGRCSVESSWFSRPDRGPDRARSVTQCSTSPTSVGGTRPPPPAAPAAPPVGAAAGPPACRPRPGCGVLCAVLLAAVALAAEVLGVQSSALFIGGTPQLRSVSMCRTLSRSI